MDDMDNGDGSPKWPWAISLNLISKLKREMVGETRDFLSAMMGHDYMKPNECDVIHYWYFDGKVSVWMMTVLNRYCYRMQRYLCDSCRLCSIRLVGSLSNLNDTMFSTRMKSSSSIVWRMTEWTIVCVRFYTTNRQILCNECNNT